MYIKLNEKAETEKAYCLPNDSWIPKSVLDGEGLVHPYYHIKDWWLTIQIENIRSSDETLKYIRKKKGFDPKERIYSINVMEGLRPMVIAINDIPKDIVDSYTSYWSRRNSDLASAEMDYPYGYECMPGDPMDFGQN